jgi:Putative peptidoglycan binding domain
MVSRKRILYLGSISILLLSGLLFVAHTKLAPTAHANACNSVATGYDSQGFPDWEANCTVSTTANTPSNYVYAIQKLMNGFLGSNSACDTPLTVDGYFGTRTQTAVECFQASVVLRQDGIVGMATWGALKKLPQACGSTISTGGIWENWCLNTANQHVDFRLWNSSGIWYVNPASAGNPAHWCRMDTSAPC